METFKDYYSLLQVHCDAEQDIIDATYRKLCKKYHPDICAQPGAEERMKEINGAYEVLGDEAKRRAYNAQYKTRNQWFNLPRTGGDAQAARKVMQSYMLALQSELYHDAYDLLSDVDKKYISLEKFTQWQRLVVTIYGVEGFEIKSSRTFEDFYADADLPLQAVRFDVEILERNKIAGTVRKYIMKKFAVQQNGRWRAYLGYKDLDGIMNEFQHLVNCQQNPEQAGEWNRYRAGIDSATGLPNRNGLIERADAEVYRYERYRQDFVVAVLQVKTSSDKDYEDRTKVHARAAHCIRNALRKGDQAGSLGRGRFALIMLKIDERSCTRVLQRICTRIERDCYAALDLRVSATAAHTSYTGGSLDTALYKCERKLK